MTKFRAIHLLRKLVKYLLDTMNTGEVIGILTRLGFKEKELIKYFGVYSYEINEFDEECNDNDYNDDDYDDYDDDDYDDDY